MNASLPTECERKIAHHEAAHATAAEVLGGAWAHIVVFRNDGAIKPAKPYLHGVERAAECLAGIWQDTAPHNNVTGWIDACQVELVRRVDGGEGDRGDAHLALEAVGFPPTAELAPLPERVVEACKLCHAAMSTRSAGERVLALAGAVLACARSREAAGGRLLLRADAPPPA